MRKLIILFCWIILCVFFVGCEKNLFSKYGSAEDYSMGASEKEIIKAIGIFKTENPEMDFTGKEDGYNGDTYYHASFYYTDKEKVLFTGVAGSKLLFISICPLIPTKKDACHRINDDMGEKENKAVKKEFEERIVNPIKAILRR